MAKSRSRATKWAIRCAALAIAGATVIVAAAIPNALAAGGYQAPIRSGLAWPSGNFVLGSNPSFNADFATYRARPLDVVTTWPGRGSWDEFINNNDIYTAYRNQPYTVAFGIPMVPDDGSTAATCATGAYNSKWTTFAHTMVDLGLGSSIIRLGWEMNGDWYPWGRNTQPSDYAACWRQIVPTVRAVAPNLKFDWNVNRGSSAGMKGDAVLGAWPGPSYVDIVGIDSYDNWLNWDQQLNDQYGLKYWLNFAVNNGKKLSVPEWGLFTTQVAGFGDDVQYIQNMHDFFAANASDIAYEAYFEDYNNDPNGDNVANSLWNPIQMPNSSVRYKALYQATNAPPPPPPAGTKRIEDTAQGTTTGKVQFSANWAKCTDTTCARAAVDGSYQWTATTGSTATVRFTGHQLKWFGMKEPFSVIATVSIDGGAPVDVDPYAATATTNTVQLYASPTLTEGNHTAVITMTDRRNSNSTGGASITFDRAEAISNA